VSDPVIELLCLKQAIAEQVQCIEAADIQSAMDAGARCAIRDIRRRAAELLAREEAKRNQIANATRTDEGRTQ